MDLVGTCPKGFWKEWLAEGDCAGDPPGDTLYCWKPDTGCLQRSVPETASTWWPTGRSEGMPSFTL